MPRYEFRVLCADSKESCNFVKGLMTDFEDVKSVDFTKPYDHVGTINADSSNKALLKKHELESIAGKSILSIEVALV